MGIIITLICILVLVLLSAFFSGMEIAYLASNRLMLEIDKERGGAKGFVLGKLFHNPDNYIATMLVANNIVLVMYGLLMSQLVSPLLEKVSLSPGLVATLLESLIATFFIIIFGEYLPKSSFKRNANGAMQRYSFLVYCFYILLYPISAFCTWLTRLLWRLTGKSGRGSLMPKISIIDLDHYLSTNISGEGASGELDTEVKIMQKAIDFSDVRARDCMIPRNEIVACALSTNLETLKTIFVKTGLSKVIVYRESIDEVMGYVHAQEVFTGEEWQQRMKKALFVPESIYGHKLMKELMQSNRSLAVVIDELGGTAGIVTLEDLVEEIFGEIEDEHDKARIVFRKIDDKHYIFSGRAEIDEINDRFALNLPEEGDYNTLAGLILNRHRSIPQKNQVVKIGRFYFTIIRSSSTRIELIRLTLLD